MACYKPQVDALHERATQGTSLSTRGEPQMQPSMEPSCVVTGHIGNHDIISEGTCSEPPQIELAFRLLDGSRQIKVVISRAPVPSYREQKPSPFPKDHCLVYVEPSNRDLEARADPLFVPL